MLEICSQDDGVQSYIRCLLSLFGYGTSAEVDPEVYLGAVGQCHLKYQQLISGILQAALTSKTSASGNIGREAIYYPHAQPAQQLRNGALPKYLAECTDASVLTFIQQFRDNPEDFRIPIPLVINTHGWVTGLGWQLLDAIGALTWSSWGIELLPAVPASAPESKSVSSTQSTKCDQSTSCDSAAELRPMKVGLPFHDLIHRFCGRLPLPWFFSSDMIVRRIQQKVSILPSGNQCLSNKRKPFVPTSAEKRWLRFMALFNTAYCLAVHLPVTSEEGKIAA